MMLLTLLLACTSEEGPPPGGCYETPEDAQVAFNLAYRAGAECTGYDWSSFAIRVWGHEVTSNCDYDACTFHDCVEWADAVSEWCLAGAEGDTPAAPEGCERYAQNTCFSPAEGG